MERESRLQWLGAGGLGRGGGWMEINCKLAQGISLGDEKVVKLIYGDGRTTL